MCSGVHYENVHIFSFRCVRCSSLLHFQGHDPAGWGIAGDVHWRRHKHTVQIEAGCVSPSLGTPYSDVRREETSCLERLIVAMSRHKNQRGAKQSEENEGGYSWASATVVTASFF